MFNEGGGGIRIAKIDTIKPWFETLKDMEQRITQNQHDQNSNGDHILGQLLNIKTIILDSYDNSDF